ncbi:MAG: hypothetical protein AAB557_06430 [Patescibacteria group bacterium]
MKKYGRPIIIGLIIGGILSAGYLFWWGKSQSAGPAGSQESLSPPAPTPAQLLAWNDPNGFSFQYPEGLVVNKHDEDKENYSHVEFTSPDHPGRLIVWGKDPGRGVTDAASWVSQEKRFIGASLLDTTLGGQQAKKVMVDGVTRVLVVGALYDGIVWSVEAALEDADFWTGVHTTIINSFAFIPVKEPGSSATSEPAPAVDDVVVDEEEVVE